MLEGKQGSSFTWKSITKANPILRKGCAWNISNGKNTKFWTDIWALQVPLRDVAVSPIPEMEAQKPVAAYMNDDGQWRVELFQQWLPTDVMDKITAIATDPLSTEEDRLCWQPTSTRDFTAKSAYWIAFPAPQTTDQQTWKAVWNLQVPERVRHFIWLVLLHRINTNKRRFERHIAPNPFCPRCVNVPETELHILRDCRPPSSIGQERCQKKTWWIS
ncbi:unnamed protein product [Linum trigynum]|uniref:Reverse transcriptase zinc-binding domain-containing protein n=1 Tax=Linum trigynum TaxID=586398 RepID=A0AAV2F601_9ROSI